MCRSSVRFVGVRVCERTIHKKTPKRVSPKTYKVHRRAPRGDEDPAVSSPGPRPARPRPTNMTFKVLTRQKRARSLKLEARPSKTRSEGHQRMRILWAKSTVLLHGQIRFPGRGSLSGDCRSLCTTSCYLPLNLHASDLRSASKTERSTP